MQMICTYYITLSPQNYQRYPEFLDFYVLEYGPFALDKCVICCDGISGRKYGKLSVDDRLHAILYLTLHHYTNVRSHAPIKRTMSNSINL